MNSTGRRSCAALAFAGALALVFATGAAAQVETSKSATSGQSTHDVTIDQATVVYANGNDVMVRLHNGQLKHFPNVPDSFRVNVDGKQMGVHDLKPGMMIERTVVKTTTPQVIKTVQSVTGRVWHVSPPNSVILTLADGKNQEFKIPNGQTFEIDGRKVDAWGLKNGMKVSATRVVEVPQTTVTENTSYAATAPPPPPPADQPILVAVVVPAAPTPAPAEPAPAAPQENLPKTASYLPLLGLLGLICLCGSFGMRLIRR